MSNVCRVTPTASRDIESIMDYLAEDSNLEMAEGFLQRIDAKFKLLSQFPQIGRKRDELYPGLRTISLDNYLIFYRLVPKGVEVVRVISGYRDLTDLFVDDENSPEDFG